MGFTNSPLVYKTMLSNKHNDRKYPISKITIHHAAGVMTFDRLLDYVAHCNRDMSANYVLRQGKLGLVVEEKYRAWTSSNAENDHRAVTIEVGNSSSGGQWPIAPEDLNMLIKWCADVCIRNNIPKLYYDGTKNGTLTLHEMFVATACLPVDRTEVLTPDGWVSLKDINIGDTIATAHIDDLQIKFSKVLDKIPEKIQDTYVIRDFEGTSDHRVIYYNQTGKQYVEQYKELFDKKGSLYIPNAGYFEGQGLPISKSDMEFFVAVQADGHYMHDGNCYYGIEFHFTKQRKIEKIKNLLNDMKIEYKICDQSNGSTKIRIYGKNIVEFCEEYLNNKKFTWNWLNMSHAQALDFLDMIMFYDGCEANKGYSSSIVENVNIVQAIASLNGVGSKVCDNGTRIYLKKEMRSLGDNNKKRKLRQTVSCVTVESGFILIRQHGRTTITGNCPGPYIKSKLNYICQEVNKLIEANNKGAIAPTPTVQSQPTYKVVTDVYGYMTAADAVNDIKRKRTVKAGTYYVFNETNTAVNVTAKLGVAGAWISKAANKQPVKTNTPTLQSIANEVIKGEWGNGTERTSSLNKAGYNAANVQQAVNAILARKPIPNIPLYLNNSKPTVIKKEITVIVNEVTDGEWGNGTERKTRLTKAGYDYDVIQREVNKRF